MCGKHGEHCEARVNLIVFAFPVQTGKERENTKERRREDL
jgi:hypothetical protein